MPVCVRKPGRGVPPCATCHANVDVPVADARRIEVVAHGLPLRGMGRGWCSMPQSSTLSPAGARRRLALTLTPDTMLVPATSGREHGSTLSWHVPSAAAWWSFVSRLAAASTVPMVCQCLPAALLPAAQAPWVAPWAAAAAHRPCASSFLKLPRAGQGDGARPSRGAGGCAVAGNTRRPAGCRSLPDHVKKCLHPQDLGVCQGGEHTRSNPRP